MVAYFIHNSLYLSPAYPYITSPHFPLLITTNLFSVFMSLLLFVIFTSLWYFLGATRE